MKILAVAAFATQLLSTFFFSPATDSLAEGPGWKLFISWQLAQLTQIIYFDQSHRVTGIYSHSQWLV